MTLQDQLVRDEGLRLFPYVDSTGNTTIGVGRNLSSKGISEDEAMVLLADDIAEAKSGVLAALPWTLQLDPVRLAVLENMVFNMGVAGLLQFTLFLAAVQQGNWVLAAAEMLDSRWAKQVGARAQRLATQIQIDQMQ
jgi:lysozyme